MEASYSHREVEEEDGEVGNIDESHTTSHSSRVSQAPALGRPAKAASATTAPSMEQIKTENAMDVDISMLSQTGDIIDVSSGTPTPRRRQQTLSQDDAHSIPDSIASSAKVSYSLDFCVFQLTRLLASTLGEPFRNDYSHALS